MSHLDKVQSPINDHKKLIRELFIHSLDHCDWDRKVVMARSFKLLDKGKKQENTQHLHNKNYSIQIGAHLQIHSSQNLRQKHSNYKNQF
jgi:hypothetical protein